ncbi:MAG TPA: hypothetical protein VMW65_02040 [Chloroflexota bacterium]|nr:hypothetical protein [Chloroflexota bacterium]
MLPNRQVTPVLVDEHVLRVIDIGHARASQTTPAASADLARALSTVTITASLLIPVSEMAGKLDANEIILCASAMSAISIRGTIDIAIDGPTTRSCADLGARQFQHWEG